MIMKMNMKMEKPVWLRFLEAKVKVQLTKAERSQVPATGNVIGKKNGEDVTYWIRINK